MKDLKKTLNGMKTKYREVFSKSLDAMVERIEKIRPTGFEGDIFDSYETGSVGRKWQLAVVEMFQNDISHEIYDKWQELIAYRDKFQCRGCGTCCNLACSEHSPEELKNRAECGDNFAKQFTKIFIPYKSKDEARIVYPEYLKLLDETLEDKVYFYHCPKLTDDKRCSDYENRPQICRVFPDNPLDILPESCGFYEWRLEVVPVAMMLHAMVEIIGYYKQKIE